VTPWCSAKDGCATHEGSHGATAKTTVLLDCLPYPRPKRPPSAHRQAGNRALTQDNGYKRARLLEQRWAGHVAALFNVLRQNASMMNPSEIDRIGALYLEGAMGAVECRLATREWNVFIGEPRGLGGWNEFAQSQVGARLAALKEALAYNDVDAETLSFAARALPGVAEETTRVLARRLIEAQYEAARAELRALQGEPLPRRAPPPIVLAAPCAAPVRQVPVALLDPR
jgi:hypothetical protein